MYRQLSSSFAFQLTPGQWGRCTEDRMSAFCEFQQHVFRNMVPSSLRTILGRISLFPRFCSKKRPLINPKSSRKCPHNVGIPYTFIFVVVSVTENVIEHWHKWNSSCESFWGLSHRALKITDFTTELQRCESWENVPLEFRRLSVDGIIIFVVSVDSYSRNSVFPNFVAFKMLKNFVETQYRIWDYIDFCALTIDDCCVIDEWQLCPRILPIQNFVQTTDVFLIVDHLCCDVKHLFQGETFLIQDNTFE